MRSKPVRLDMDIIREAQAEQKRLSTQGIELSEGKALKALIQRLKKN